MNLKSKELSISDEYFGCTITFYEKKQEIYNDDLSIDEIIKSIGAYLMIQRTYPEDEFGKDYYTIELSGFEKSGKLEEFKIELDRHIFKIEWDSEKVEIEFDIDNYWCCVNFLKLQINNYISIRYKRSLIF